MQIRADPEHCNQEYYIPPSRLTSTDKFPLTSFPRAWCLLNMPTSYAVLSPSFACLVSYPSVGLPFPVHLAAKPLSWACGAQWVYRRPLAICLTGLRGLRYASGNIILLTYLLTDLLIYLLECCAKSMHVFRSWSLATIFATTQQSREAKKLSLVALSLIICILLHSGYCQENLYLFCDVGKSCWWNSSGGRADDEHRVFWRILIRTQVLIFLLYIRPLTVNLKSLQLTKQNVNVCEWTAGN